jgi:site-specific DNA-cytosine methylase
MWGGKAQVPADIDLLVAGFACDDFSTLNNVRKTLEEKGESGDTFFAIKMYMHLYRPKLVVLENVMGAPWTDEKARTLTKKKKGKLQTSITKHLDQIGYQTIYLKLDTKEHYLPHTRQRGYMICVDRASMPAKTDWEALEIACTAMVDDLRHTATVPVEAMLFTADDPRLQVLFDHDKKCENKVVKWEKCKIGHLDYCAQHGLGDRHPITNWKPDGSKEMPDFYMLMPGMTERVADSLDISHKRNLTRGFDDRFLK